MSAEYPKAAPGDAWERERLTPCRDCPHRNLGHFSAKHPTRPEACMHCDCLRFVPQPLDTTTRVTRKAVRETS
jgi:hypothetical protein